MNYKKQLQLTQMVEKAIDKSVTIPLLFKYIDYENEMTLLLNDCFILEQFELYIREQNHNSTFNLDFKPQKKEILIHKMMKLILEKSQIDEILLVNSMRVRLKQYFQKVNFMEGVNLLAEYDQKTITLGDLKKNFLLKQVMNQEQLPISWILDSISVDQDDLQLKLTNEFKVSLKLQQLPIGQYQQPLKQNEAQIINKLLKSNREELAGYIQSDSAMKLLQKLKDNEQFTETYQNISQFIMDPQIEQDNYKSNSDINQKYRKKGLILNKIKIVYLNYICQNQIIIPELIQYIQMIKRKTGSIKLRIQTTLTFRQELSHQNQLQQLNHQFDLDNFFKKDFDWDEINYYEQQLLPSFNNLLLDEEILLYGIVRNLQKYQYIMREQLLTQLQRYNVQDLIHKQHLFEKQSISKSIITILSQMKDSLSFLRLDLQHSEFREAFINMSTQNNQIMHFNTHPFAVKNLRKVLEQMVSKQYSFPEIIEYIFLCIRKCKSYLRINKNETLLQLFEQDPQIQLFMCKIISQYNNEINYVDKIKLSNFEQIPHITPQFKMNDEQKCIIQLLEIVYQQKEYIKDRLIYIMNKDKVKSLIYELQQTQLKPSGRQGHLQTGYNLLYDLYQWTKCTNV